MALAGIMFQCVYELRVTHRTNTGYSAPENWWGGGGGGGGEYAEYTSTVLCM